MFIGSRLKTFNSTCLKSRTRCIWVTGCRSSFYKVFSEGGIEYQWRQSWPSDLHKRIYKYILYIRVRVCVCLFEGSWREARRNWLERPRQIKCPLLGCILLNKLPILKDLQWKLCMYYVYRSFENNIIYLNPGSFSLRLFPLNGLCRQKMFLITLINTILPSTHKYLHRYILRICKRIYTKKFWMFYLDLNDKPKLSRIRLW